jgi:radical SAM protein with 4Fe4S-binding SPASM domain
MSKGISIIIANYNQTEELNNLLLSISTATKNFIGSYEIIIVADGKSVELDKKFLEEKNIKYFQNTKNLGSGLTRHFGVINSKYDIIFFIDSDTEIRGNFLNVIDSNLRDKPIDGIIGVTDELPLNENSTTANFLAAETNFYGNNCKITNHQFFIGLCGAIKKDVYLNNLGFFHRYIDDMEFSSRLQKNIQIQTVKDLKFKHNYSNLFTNLKKLFLRSFFFSQLSKKPFSPWFSKIRKLSVISSFLTFLLFPLVFFESKFIYLSGFFFSIYLLTCFELLKFKNKFYNKLLFLPVKFFLQISIGFGYSLGLTKKIFQDLINYLIIKSGPFRIYLKYKKPTYLILYVTGKCNSKCSYCFQWDILNIKSRIKKELTLKEYELFAENLGPIEHLTLGGGEPTLRQDLSDIAITFYKKCRVRNISMPSNGIRPDLLEHHVERILKNCPKLVLKVSLSIDGYKDEHDKLRGVLGNYERLIESDKVLRSLRKKYDNLYYIINTVFTGQNQNNVLNTIKKNKENFDHDIQVSTFVRGSLADEKSKDVDINKYFEIVDYLENIQALENKSNSYALETLHQGLQIESRSAIKHVMTEGKGKYSCTAGKSMLVMDELGNVNPCEILPSKFGYGNIRNYNMNVNLMWKEQKIKKIQNRIKKEKCFCTWECAQLNSIAFSPKGILNMFKHAFKIKDRRKTIKKMGNNISFEDYKKYFIKKEKNITELDKYVHPMINEGNNLNPFNIKYEISEKNEVINQKGMNEKELDYKKEKWLKPVKAGKVPDSYKYK